jgi:hypothetical protein
VDELSLRIIMLSTTVNTFSNESFPQYIFPAAYTALETVMRSPVSFYVDARTYTVFILLLASKFVSSANSLKILSSTCTSSFLQIYLSL